MAHKLINNTYEILDEIIEEILKKNPETLKDINEIKKSLIKLIDEENINFEEFKKVKEEYIKSREPIIEAALRLVKKIVNNQDDAFNIFYNEYYKN